VTGTGRRLGRETEAERAPLRLGSIEFAESGIAEWTRDGHRSVFVPSASIERVTVAHGFTCERPIAAFVGTVLCLGLAALGAWFMIASFLRGSVRYISITAILAPAVIGSMCFWTLIRRGRYLRIDTGRDSRKLVLHGAEDRDALREFLNVGRSRFGYDIDLSSVDEAYRKQR
jgi:hypothetical protein